MNAADYLLKPVTRPRFDQAIERCRASTGEAPSLRLGSLQEDALRVPPRRFLVRDRGRIVPVPVSSIDWIEAEGDYVRIHAGAASHLVERTLTEMERLLTPRGFARVHRGAVVNLDRVEELHTEGSGRYRLRLRGGQEIAVSRTYSARFRTGLI